MTVEELHKHFGEVRAVDGVSLQLAEGQVVSLIGPNGAGKTTLINLISGFFPPDSGQITFLGHDITHRTAQERIRAGIARSFQIVNLYDRLSVLDNVRIGIISREQRTNRFYALLERDGGVRHEAERVLATFGLDGKSPVPARDLSQGERKLLDVAIAYALRPKLLLLDEPTSGVSTRDKGQVMDTVIQALRQEKLTAMIVEHDMDIVFKYSDRVVVMHEGHVLAEGSPEAIRDNEEVQTTLLGVAGQPHA